MFRTFFRNSISLNTFYLKSCPVSSSKRILSMMLSAKLIGTHDGVFHCDEVLAIYMLQQLPEFMDASVIRTRDPERLKNCEIVVDVGAEFNHEKKRYDHHQRGFNSTLSSLRPELGDRYRIKLSSAGLIYAYYGEGVIRSLYDSLSIVEKRISPLTFENIQLIYRKVYQNFVEEVDAIDNGISVCHGEPRYIIRTDLSTRVGQLNPDWNNTYMEVIDGFNQALIMVGQEFSSFVHNCLTVWLPARQLVQEAIYKRLQTHESGEILEFTERFPWKEHLFDLEPENNLQGIIKYVVFMDQPGSWRVQAVPVTPSSFVTRKALKQQWWGIRDEQLSDEAGIEGCIFCHASGFIGGNSTRDGAIMMAVKSLEDDPEPTQLPENGAVQMEPVFFFGSISSGSSSSTLGDGDEEQGAAKGDKDQTAQGGTEQGAA